MEGTAINPIPEVKHYQVEGIQGCSHPNNRIEVWPALKERGLEAPPEKYPCPALCLNQNGNTELPHSANCHNKTRDTIDAMALWAAKWVCKDVDIRVDKLINIIQKVNDRAEEGLKAQREYIHALSPKTAQAISKIPAKVLQSAEFLDALKEIGANREKIEKLEAELVVTKEEVADLREKLQRLSDVVAQLQNN